MSRKDFKKHMRNFNFNILFKIGKSKQIYLDTLVNQINQYCTKKSPELNKKYLKILLFTKYCNYLVLFLSFGKINFFML